jgi:hypothetical protein
MAFWSVQEDNSNRRSQRELRYLGFVTGGEPDG